MIVGVLTAVATSVGLAQALALLDQTRKLRRAGSAREVSVTFLAASLTGSVIWLAYGLLRIDPALLIVNSAGLFGASATLVTALRLRRRHPAAGVEARPQAGLAMEPASAMASAAGRESATGREPEPRPQPDGVAPPTRLGPTRRVGSACPPTPAAPRVEHIRLSPAVGRHRDLAMLN
ncbi:SemiSWEET family transporter [Actinopolymorpha sp. B17G11]|uniref:SemiSWEET family sugar transporter n=1 Tax=Actinopolymorpha sp. B17G11 TaxID=3160861 RepID=UPI0032E4AA91